MEIKFKTREAEESRIVNFDFPADLDGFVEAYGADTVKEAAQASFVITLQALARRNIEKSDSEIQELINGWNPNERAAPTKKTPFERATSALAGMSPEEKAELLARLQAG